MKQKKRNNWIVESYNDQTDTVTIIAKDLSEVAALDKLIELEKNAEPNTSYSTHQEK